MPRSAALGIAALPVVALFLQPAPAQQATPSEVPTPVGPGFEVDSPIEPSPVLTLDQDRLFLGSAYGRRVDGEIAAASQALAAENRAIEAKLTAEEQDLTERRPTLPAAEFRLLADDFDARVVEIRRVQDEKVKRLSSRLDEERQRFYRAAAPVLGELVREAGAVAILDNRAVFLSADRIDVTDEAIARIDRMLGDGSALSPPPDPVPDPEPLPPPGGND